jgi:hypothetical protein
MIYLAAVVSSLCAVLLWFVVPSGASARNGGADLEDVINPFGGTREQWEAINRDGGLQKHDRWNGLPVSKASLRFDSVGNVVEIAVSTSQLLATVREIREPINRICGFKEPDWDMTTSSNFLSGSAENSRCKAAYLPEEDKFWTYSIKRRARLAN